MEVSEQRRSFFGLGLSTGELDHWLTCHAHCLVVRMTLDYAGDDVVRHVDTVKMEKMYNSLWSTRPCIILLQLILHSIDHAR